MHHKPSGKSMAYASLLNTAATLPVPDVSQLKLKSRPEEFKLLGTFVRGVDNQKILTGQPLFGSDIRLDGMFYAMYQKSPVFGGKARSANLDHILTLPGVTHAFIVDGTDEYNGLQPGVAVVGTSFWEVDNARKQLEVDWETTHSDSTESYDRKPKNWPARWAKSCVMTVTWTPHLRLRPRSWRPVITTRSWPTPTWSR